MSAFLWADGIMKAIDSNKNGYVSISNFNENINGANTKLMTYIANKIILDEQFGIVKNEE